MVDLVGQEIGNYRLLNRLASGGFGNVYLAQHTLLPERRVAIKLLHTSLTSQEERDQFLQEARFLEQLKHPHILPLIDVGISDELPYQITEYASGGSLRDLLKQYKSSGLPQDMALTILYQICEALQYAHQRQVIHRDLKPENILFNDGGEVLLADFGIATVLGNTSIQLTDSSIGTPRYMAPEQFKGMISKESDQYALGCIAYEMFTGHYAFVASSIPELAFKHAAEAPIPPTQLNPAIPQAAETAILNAIAKQRNLRYSGVSAFMEAISSSSPSPENVDTTIPDSILPQEPAPIPESKPEPAIAEQTDSKRVKLLRLNRSQLIAMLIGTIVYSSLIVFIQLSLSISVSVGAWVFDPIIPIGSIFVWCLLLTIAFFVGARYGPLVGLVVGGLGFFLGAYISHIVSDPMSLSYYIQQYYFRNISLNPPHQAYPILKSYFNLSLSLIGFITGFAFLKTAGNYATRHSLFIAERYGIIASIITGLAIFLVLVAWRAFSQVTLFINLSVKFWITCIPALLLLPILLLAGNAISRSYHRMLEHRGKKIITSTP